MSAGPHPRKRSIHSFGLLGLDSRSSQYLPDPFPPVPGDGGDVHLPGTFLRSPDYGRMQLVPCSGDVILGVLELLLGIIDSLERSIVRTFGSLKVIQHEAILACPDQAKCRYFNDASSIFTMRHHHRMV